MKRYLCNVFLASSLVISGHVWGQAGPPVSTAATARPVEQSYTNAFISQSDLKEIAEFMDHIRLLERKDLVSPTVAKTRTSKMLKALQVSCELTDAAQQGSGRETIGGKQVSIGLYEVSCADGMGYLLSTQAASVSGISCFAAEGSAASNPADASKVGAKCQLAANVDSKLMAAAVVRNVGASCVVRELKWLGQSAAKLDYTEVACNDNKGYVLRTPIPGNQGKIDAVSCQDAVAQGVKCQLTTVAVAEAPSAAGADERPTLQWFKDALIRNGVSCNAKQARIAGREKIKRRYIVEFQCDHQPQGLVVYVPTAVDTTNLFESMDCAAAAIRGITCQFATIKAAGN
jgi:hypothetical protein